MAAKINELVASIMDPNVPMAEVDRMFENLVAGK